MINTIQQLVGALPEKYQPIFGHPELSDEVSRACEDRSVVIRETYDALQTLLGRPLRVLDLGCAQGYFSLSLAAAGADVLGVDYLHTNVAVCEALMLEHPHLKAKFQMGRIEDVIERIQPDEFDLVLGLSVFHHIIHENGIPAVKRLLNVAAERVGYLLLELALKSEPLYWGPSQAEDPRELLGDIAFTHQLALHPTHLADIPRPMFAASNRFWVLSGKAQQILSWTTEPHSLVHGVHQGGRRYYQSASSFLKWYRIDKPHWHYNQIDFQRECEFLERAPSSFPAPKKLAHGSTNTEAWLLMERLNGQLLSELLISGAEIDVSRVLGDVISQACKLEAAGWYHNDIRTWNTLIQEDGRAILIDYGSIVRKPQDCVWPNNIFLAFLIFLHEVATRHVETPIPLRAVAMSPGRFPVPYDTLVRRLWAVPVAQWSFSLVKEFFDDVELKVEASIQPSEAWSTAIELAIQTLSANQHHLDFKAQQAEIKAQQAETKAQQAETKAQQAETKAQQAETKAQQAETKAQQAETSARRWQIQANEWHERILALHASTSWRITKPLRAIKRLLSGDFAALQRSTATVKLKAKQAFRPVVSSGVAYVFNRPALRKILSPCLKCFPSLHRRLLCVAVNTGVVEDGSGIGQRQSASAGNSVQFPMPPELHAMTPRARQIYMDLKAAIENKAREGV